jgi:hypothetical protein
MGVLFLFFTVLGLELRVYTFFMMGFFVIESPKLFAQAGQNHDPPDLCLLNS